MNFILCALLREFIGPLITEDVRMNSTFGEAMRILILGADANSRSLVL